MPTIREYRAQTLRLRAGGCSTGGIAAEFARQYGLNPRAAFRAANGMTQEDVAAAWNARWPSEDGEAELTGKQISYWEAWPGPTGREPSIRTVSRLAHVYGCRHTDLITDMVDAAVLGPGVDRGIADGDAAWPGLTRPAHGELLPAGAGVVVPDRQSGAFAADGEDMTAVPAVMWTADTSAIFFVSGGSEVRSEEVERALRMVGARVDRRGIIKIAAAGPLVAARGSVPGAPGLSALTHDLRVSDEALASVERVVLECRHLDDVLGARAVLPTVLAQVELVEGMLRAGPSERYRQRLLSLLAQIHVVSGFLHFDLSGFDRARWHYEQARSAAYDSGDAAVAAFVMGHRAKLERKVRRTGEGIEYAGAAQAWASRTDSPRAQVYAAGELVGAHIAHGGHTYAQQLIDQWLPDVPQIVGGAGDDPAGTLFYWIGHGALLWTVARIALARHEPDKALTAYEDKLRYLDPRRIRDVSWVFLDQADAYVQQDEIDAAAAKLGDAAELIVQHRSILAIERFHSARARAGRHGESHALAELDERVASLGIPRAPSSTV